MLAILRERSHEITRNNLLDGLLARRNGTQSLLRRRGHSRRSGRGSPLLLALDPAEVDRVRVVALVDGIGGHSGLYGVGRRWLGGPGDHGGLVYQRQLARRSYSTVLLRQQVQYSFRKKHKNNI